MTPARRAVFRLALALGRADPDQMLSELPLPTVLEWLDYAQLEPFGEVRADYRSAVVAHTMASLWSRGRHKVEDFLVVPPEQVRSEATTPEGMQRLTDTLAALGIGSHGHPEPGDPISGG